MGIDIRAIVSLYIYFAFNLNNLLKEEFISTIIIEFLFANKPSSCQAVLGSHPAAGVETKLRFLQSFLEKLTKQWDNESSHIVPAEPDFYATNPISNRRRGIQCWSTPICGLHSRQKSKIFLYLIINTYYYLKNKFTYWYLQLFLM